MGSLILGGCAALMAAAASTGSPAGRWQPEIAQASERFALPAQWIERVIDAESGGRARIDGRPTTSRSGAMGLMQLMPGTWREIRARHALGDDPHDPRDNILAGTAYLREMYDRFGYPGLFAAYNAGPARYRLHLETGAPLPGETRSYLAKLTRAAADGRPPARPAAPTDSAVAGSNNGPDPLHAPIFVRLGESALPADPNPR